jgi:hypothetical protein
MTRDLWNRESTGLAYGESVLDAPSDTSTDPTDEADCDQEVAADPDRPSPLLGRAGCVVPKSCPANRTFRRAM